jgi:hypothetical protein
MTTDHTSEPIPAKATKADDQSDGIVVSFGAEWHKPLLEAKFKAVIRKRVPKTVVPKWLYFHINSPVSALCARAEILAIRELTPTQARAKARDLALSVADVDGYMGGENIGCYEIGQITFAHRELGSDDLNTRIIYHPPQSFFILSKAAKQIVDQLAGFQDIRERKSTKSRS